MGNGGSKSETSDAVPVPIRRKIQQFRRRRKIGAFRDSIVSTEELLQYGRDDLESIAEARLSIACADIDSIDLKETALSTVPESEEELKPESVKAVTPESVEAVTPDGPVRELDDVAPAEGENAPAKVEEEGVELGFADLPASPSFRYFATIAESFNSVDSSKEEEGNPVDIEIDSEESEGSCGRLRKKKKSKGMKIIALARGPAVVCGLLNVQACYGAKDIPKTCKNLHSKEENHT